MAFAYLFERYPSFTQTFCVREVLALRDSGRSFPVFAIRQPESEPSQTFPPRALEGIIRVPEDFCHILANDVHFRRLARKWQGELGKIWGGNDAEKHRVYEALWLGEECRRLGIEHVHVHFAGLASRTAYWMHRIFGIRYSVTAHANEIFRDEPPERLGQVFAAAEVVVTVSDFSVRYLEEMYPGLKGKFRRVYNGIETSGFAQSDFPPRPLVLAVGRYIEKKGFQDLVESCALLPGSDFECLIVGQGPLEGNLREKVERLGLQDKVQITGPRTEQEIRGLLARARMFVLPCIQAGDGARDNLPTVIMEAMAAGLPVISTPVAGIPEMVLDGSTGYLVSEHDPAAMAHRMRELLADRDLAASLGSRGRGLCVERFDLLSTSRHLLEVLHDKGAFDHRARGIAGWFRR